MLPGSSSGAWSTGRHSVVWDGRDNRGRSVSAGVYFYSFEAGDYKSTKKLMLMLVQ